jgi:hypothetical protein
MHKSHFGAVRKVRESHFDCMGMLRIAALTFTAFLVLSAPVFGQDYTPPPPKNQLLKNQA